MTAATPGFVQMGAPALLVKKLVLGYNFVITPYFRNCDAIRSICYFPDP